MPKAKIDFKISAAMRDLWMKSEPRRLALVRSRIPCEDGSRKKFLETCEECGRTAYIGEREFKVKRDGTTSKLQRKILVVHHKKEVPNVWAPDFMKMLFCHQDDLKVVCHSCHEKIHKELRDCH